MSPKSPPDPVDPRAENTSDSQREIRRRFEASSFDELLKMGTVVKVEIVNRGDRKPLDKKD